MSEKNILYSARNTSGWGFNPKNTEKAAGHYYFQTNEVQLVWPVEVSEKYINPKTVSDLITLFNWKEILFLDAVKNVNGLATITGHVNRSGMNFLRGNTPYKNLPRFPDMSHIYTPFSNLEKVTTHTLGIDRLETEKEPDVIWGETAGIITPVLHYCGLKVQAICGERNSDNTKALQSLIHLTEDNS